MDWWDGLSLLSAVVLGAVAIVAVSRVQRRGADRRAADAKGPIKWMLKHPWPLLAGVCAAGLAGAAVGEYTWNDFGEDAQNHSILVGALTGTAVLGITVLVIEALLQKVAAEPWKSSLQETWKAVVRAGRRGADDIADDLGGERYRVRADTLPQSGSAEAKAAYDAAWRLQFEIGLRVDRASHAAFAAGESALDDALHDLFTTADNLQRVVYRWFTGRRSRSAGEPRTAEDVEESWRTYLESLMRLNQEGVDLGFDPAITPGYKSWIDEELAELRRIAEPEARAELGAYRAEVVAWREATEARMGRQEELLAALNERVVGIARELDAVRSSVIAIRGRLDDGWAAVSKLWARTRRSHGP